MELKEAEKIVGNRATWELRHMKRALSMFPILNTDEENKRLEAVETILRRSKSQGRNSR